MEVEAADGQAKVHVLPPTADLNGHPKGKHCVHDGIITSGE